MADISTIYSDIDAIDSEVSNQYDQLEIARTMLLNKAAGGGGSFEKVQEFEFSIDEDYTSGTLAVAARVSISLGLQSDGAYLCEVKYLGQQQSSNPQFMSKKMIGSGATPRFTTGLIFTSGKVPMMPATVNYGVNVYVAYNFVEIPIRYHELYGDIKAGVYRVTIYDIGG